MTRRGLAKLATGAATMAATGAVALESGPEAAVRALFERYVAAWNAGDMDAMGRLYADDVHWVNIVGMHWRGFQAVDRAHRAFFDLMFRGVKSKLVDVERARALPGGAVVAVGRLAVDAFRQPNGVVRPAEETRMTLVLEPQDGEFRIVHGSNVSVVAEAERFDPAAAAT